MLTLIASQAPDKDFAGCAFARDQWHRRVTTTSRTASVDSGHPDHRLCYRRQAVAAVKKWSRRLPVKPIDLLNELKTVVFDALELTSGALTAAWESRRRKCRLTSSSSRAMRQLLETPPSSRLRMPRF
ncbi:MAG: hypothetical protein R3C20_09790 [Planctomycetaceae bacterium]